jgi:MoxR-like ATPase
MQVMSGRELGQRMRNAFSRVIVGLERPVETVILGMLTPGDIHHVSFEGNPGVGKTLLAETAARVVSGTYQRVQGLPDLLPSSFLGYIKYLDEIGIRKVLKPGTLTLESWQILVEHFRRRGDINVLLESNDFTKLPGIEALVKIFPVIVLYDEASRTNPWANSAPLEAMQEYKTTVDGVPIPRNPAELWILTRNKLERGQTFAYPEAMQSRLAFEDELPTPTEPQARELLGRDKRLIYQKRAVSLVEPVLTVDELLAVREHIANNIAVSPAMDDYIMKLVSGCLNQSFLRERLGVTKVPLVSGGVLNLESEQVMRTDYPGGTAPGRVMLTLKQIAKTAAYLRDLQYARPEHLKKVFHRAIMHHIFVDVSAELRQQGVKGSDVARAIANIVLYVVDEPSD